MGDTVVQVPAALAPVLNYPVILAITASFKGVVPDRYLHLIALAIGAALGALMSLALGPVGRDVLYAALVGLAVGAMASGTYSGIASTVWDQAKKQMIPRQGPDFGIATDWHNDVVRAVNEAQADGKTV